MWIDSHCHLNHPKFEGADPQALAREALAAGVSGMVSICCRISDEFPRLLKMAQSIPNVWCTVGTHPHEAGDAAERAITQMELVRLANSDPKVIGIGECGLDYYYDHAPRDVQAAVFRTHIRAAMETGLPLIIHTREAEEDTIRILREEGAGDGKLKAVLHCFTSSRALAEAGLDMGLYISFSGIVTFKNSVDLLEIAKSVPDDRILVETDAPFLAPMPYRGKMNQPAYVAHTGEFLACSRNVSRETFAEQTTRNFFTLFDKAGHLYLRTKKR